MRIQVDLNRCHLYAQCCFLAPEVFRLEAEECLVYHPNPNDEWRRQIVMAATACPKGAILIEPEGEPPS